MRLPGKKSVLAAGLAMLLLLALIGAATAPAQAAAEDVAMFHDELASYGTWVEYGNYGPVWYPTQGVTSNWRPYVDGRWVPTAEGYIFESGEPWAWATYHFGNWMPTTEYGWVWSPGSTWYPSTVAWRTSPETTPVDKSYVGWAPIPPPDYVPEPAYYPTGGYGGGYGGYAPGGYGGYGGYGAGAPLTDLLTAPFWIFAQAASFLLGFNQPYLPSYSYYNCGCLSPYSYTPVLYPNTFFLNDFYSPAFAPRAFFAFGPAFPFVARVTNINVVNINNFANNVNIVRVRNGLPPDRVLNRRPFLREAIPAQVREGRRFQVQRVADPGQVGRRQLANPTVLPPPRNVPRLTREIPRGVTPQVQPERRGPGAVTPPRGERAPQAVTTPRGEGAPRGVTQPRGEGPPRDVTTPRGEGAPRVTTPRGEGAPRVTTPRAPRETPEVMTAPGRERQAPTRGPSRELRTPAQPPAGQFTAPGREQRAPRGGPSREVRPPSRGTTMPPPATHQLTPRMERQIRQAPSRPAPSAPAPRMAPSAPAPRPAAPAPRMAPPAPAPRPSAPQQRPSAPAPGGGGGKGGGGGGRGGGK